MNLKEVKTYRKRVRTVGIELEGGWRNDIKLPLKTDSSVRFSDIEVPEEFLHAGTTYQEWRYKHIPAQIGEVSSPPLLISGPKGDQKSLRGWMTKFYPPFVNDTCGLHVHMGFTNPFVYQRLMVPEFDNELMNEIELWAHEHLPSNHHIFSRLRGDSRYCKRKFDADKQVCLTEKRFNQDEDGNRYTAVNYAWGRFKTIEIRVLPMMPTSELGIEAVELVIDTTDRFLAATAKRKEPKIIIAGVVDTGADKRSFVECV